MPKGSVLFTSRAPIGYVAIASNPLSTNQGFKSIVPYIADCSRFVATAMKAFAPEIDAKAPGTTFKEVSGKIVAAIPFPLPPLAEQHRIVAKVDELMGLCDRLETARGGRERSRDRLAAASLARLNAPDPATFQVDARFALDALPALTTRPTRSRPSARPSSTSPCAASSCRKTGTTNPRRNCSSGSLRSGQGLKRPKTPDETAKQTFPTYGQTRLCRSVGVGPKSARLLCR
jgi:Type I restriction modification DNA specificity domain